MLRSIAAPWVPRFAWSLIPSRATALPYSLLEVKVAPFTSVPVLAAPGDVGGRCAGDFVECVPGVIPSGSATSSRRDSEFSKMSGRGG